MTKSLIAGAEELGVIEGTPVPDFTLGQQLGIAPHIDNIDSSTPLVVPPVLLVVLQTPTMWDAYPKLYRSLKTCMESCAKSVTGIDPGYTMETQSTPGGQDGQQILTPSNAKRTEMSPSFVFQERPGNPIWNLMRKWITDTQDPDTKIAFQGLKLNGNINYVMSSYSMTMMALMFDMTGRTENLMDAVLMTNMFPLATGELGMQRVPGETLTPERSVNFSCLYRHNAYTRAAGVELANQLQLDKLAYEQAMMGNISVSAKLADTGIAQEAAAFAAS